MLECIATSFASKAKPFTFNDATIKIGSSNKIICAVDEINVIYHLHCNCTLSTHRQPLLEDNILKRVQTVVMRRRRTVWDRQQTLISDVPKQWTTRTAIRSGSLSRLCRHHTVRLSTEL